MRYQEIKPNKPNRVVASFPMSTQIGPDTWDESRPSFVCGRDVTIGALIDWYYSRLRRGPFSIRLDGDESDEEPTDD